MNLDYPTNTYDLYLNYSVICLVSYFLSAYVFCKSQNIILKKIQCVYLFVSGVVITVLFVCVRLNNYPLSFFLRFLLIPLLLSLLIKYRNNLFKTLVIGLVSLAFVTVIRIVADIITAVIFWAFQVVPKGVFGYLPCEVITIFLCVILINIKRFRNGFQFFQKDNNLGLGLIISAIVMILKCMNLRDNQEVDYMHIIFFVGGISSAFGLYLWIRRSITSHYRERLQLKSEEHYKEVLEVRDKEIEKLNQSNEYLAKIVHRDNHLMNSLNAFIDLYLSSDDKEYINGLLRDIQTLAKERSELLAKEQLESKILPSTGNLLIDGAVNDLYIKASAHGIDFNLAVSATVDVVIGKYISQTDLQTLLSDHIKDAIIAVENREEAGGKILVNLSMQNENYCIEIYDSGVVPIQGAAVSDS